MNKYDVLTELDKDTRERIGTYTREKPFSYFSFSSAPVYYTYNDAEGNPQKIIIDKLARSGKYIVDNTGTKIDQIELETIYGGKRKTKRRRKGRRHRKTKRRSRRLR
jgi:hypothetical protein